jgi:hypothetical protein
VVSIIISSIPHVVPGRLKSSPGSRGLQEIAARKSGWQGSTEKLVTPIWINPISLSESMPCLEVRSGGKQIYPV